ncbi:hypothetical protein FRB99_000574 [Tulasnella sp. 403]|nr:hypothetical protein FRB99_000574 [Tulasnella sp. 403]
MSSTFDSPSRVRYPRAPIATPGPSNAQMTMYLNIGIWSVVALFAIATLPRAWARYRHPTVKHHQGWKLRSSHRTPSTTQRSSFDDIPSAEKDKDKGESYMYEVSPSTRPDSPSLPSTSQPRPGTSLPSRIPSPRAFFHPVTRYLSRPFFTTGYTIQQAIMMTIYTGLICFGTLYHNVPNHGPRRAGWLATGQFPLVFALGAKNNIVGFLVGMGYEKLNVWHRWVGKTIFLSSLFHVVGYLVRWTIRGTLVEACKELWIGWITFAGMALLAVVSLPPVRRSAYALFWHSHWIGYVMMIVSLPFHAEGTWQYAIASGGIVVLDHVCRFFKTHLTTATLTLVPDLGCTRVEISHLTSGWRAGQHVRLWAVSSQMGIWSLIEPHPFTIATVSKGGGREGLVLYVKQAGDWTEKLYDIAKTGAESQGENAGKGVEMRVVLEGPYGGPGHDVFSTFSAAFIVVGGSGVTFGLSTVDEILRESERGYAKTRFVHVVWIVQSPTSLMHMNDVFQSFLARSRLLSINLNITVYYTRAIPHDLSSALSSPASEKGFQFPTNIELVPGRPRLDQVLNTFLEKVSGVEEKLDGVVVGVCGPESLRDAMRKVERSVKGSVRKTVGGVELVEETFGW